MGLSVPVGIKIKWCHDNGSHVTKVQTDASRTYASESLRSSDYQFCGWNINPQAPYEVRWRYFHRNGGYIYWEYGSRIEAQYGNRWQIEWKKIRVPNPASEKKHSTFIVPKIHNACTKDHFTASIGIIGDSRGRSKLWLE